MVIAELVDGCGLKCALCWNRNRVGSMEQMSLDTVDKIIERYDGNRIDWYNWGEPLLHKDFITVAKMVYGLSSHISSSLSFIIRDSYLEALQNFKSVRVSISGLTEDVYNIYNKGGNFKLVMSNLKRLAMFNRTRFIIHWEDHKYNRHQQEECRSFCDDLGAEFCLTNLNCEVEDLVEGFNHELLRDPMFSSRRPECKLLSQHSIGVKGDYYLCCASHNVPIGLTINDDFTTREMVEIKKETDLCKACREGSFWRMF